jgi:hypothetical protein
MIGISAFMWQQLNEKTQILTKTEELLALKETIIKNQQTNLDLSKKTADKCQEIVKTMGALVSTCMRFPDVGECLRKTGADKIFN